MPRFEDKIIMVCAECFTAACWSGEFYCDEFKTANTVEKTVRELRNMDICQEHEGFWSDDYMLKLYGEKAPFGYRRCDK